MLESISTLSLLAQAAENAAPAEPFLKSSTGVLLLLILAVAAGFFLARTISNSLRVPEFGGRTAVVLIAFFVASLMIWSKWAPKLGVDLRGGINMVGSLNLAEFMATAGTDGEPPTAKDIIPALIRRVNPAGTKEIMIRPLGEDKIEVTIPSVDPQEADEIWDRLVKAGKLEFRIVANAQDFTEEVSLAREMAASGSRSRRVVKTDADGKEKVVAQWVALARKVGPDGEITPNAGFKYIPMPGHLVRNKSTGELIDLSSVRLPNDSDKQGEALAEWCAEQGIRTPQILVIVPEESMNVEGKHLRNVRSTIDESGRGSVAFDTSAEGAPRMGLLTRRNIEQPMGIVLDGQLHSAPNIQSKIYKNGRITGDFTPAEVEELIINLESGKLDVALNKVPISRDFIESNLGRELKEKGFWAIGCSLLLVLVFMLFYYRFAGVVATIGLILNLVLILALVMAIDQPLTLTGLAGLVLTVGMSVDANVLIFERIREELDRGAALRMAIRNGFDKATTTIIDANVTTLITALVLYLIGTEQIKGFAVTLILGILMSMFTAIYVSRLVFDIWERKRWLTKLSMTRILDKSKYNFLNKVGFTGIISAALILVGIASMYLLGPRILDHDLRGGSTVRMVFKDKQEADYVKTKLADLKHEHNGEEIEFNVSAIEGIMDASMAGRVFKVDSNLPAWEGEKSGEERFQQLDELLAETFKGELELHHVDIVGGQPKAPADEAGAPPATDTGSLLPRSRGGSFSGAMIGALTTSMVTYQETPEGTQENPPTESASAEPQLGESPAAESTTQLPAEPATGQPATNQDSSAGLPAISAGDDGADEQAEAPERIQLQMIKRSLKVTPPVSGKSLKNLLVTASETAGLALEEEQIKVDSPDVKADEGAATTVSEDWIVEMEVSDGGEADSILDKFASKFNEQAYFPTSSKVGGQIAGQTQLQAFGAVFASLLGIIAYVWIRFQNVAFGLAAVIALIHDVLIVLGAIAISHWLAGTPLTLLGIVNFKISLEIVAALLTVIGYSLNDTIVVFDRIREVRGKRTEITADMINTSISQTLSRTILTSLTTFIVVFILYCFGGDAIHGFAFALTVGVVVGTYSSIFVASPALLWLMNTCGLNPGIVDPATE